MRRMVVAVVLALFSLPTLSAHAVGDLFVTLPAVEFRGGTLLSYSFLGGGSGYCDGPCEMATSAELPHGARIVGLEIDACRDTEADAVMSFSLYRRLPNDSTTVAGNRIEALANGLVTEIGCDYRLATTDKTKPLVVNTYGNEYVIVVSVGSPICTSNCPDEGSRFQAVRVYYEVNSSGGPVEPTKPTGEPSLFP